MLTVQQVAERLAVSDDTVICYVKSRQLRGILVSKWARSRKPRFRISEQDLAAFVASRTVGAVTTVRRSRRADYERIV